MTEVDYKRRCESYEKMLGVGDYDPVKSAFVVYVKMMNQQVDFLNEFNIKSSITETDKDSPKYKRAMEMVDGLPKMMTSVNDLRAVLKFTKDDIMKIEGNKAVFATITTPESISDVLGNKAGQKD